MKKTFSIIIILFTALFLMYLEGLKKNNDDSITKNIYDSLMVNSNQKQIAEKRTKLELMAMNEREKLRVTVEHDNSPLTNTYPVILDASGSYDPDLGDEIKFEWKQVSGPNTSIMPNNYKPKVSFEGTPGEYTFELIVSDNYGATNKIVKTVIIEPEPNKAPIINMKIRQGSELK